MGFPTPPPLKIKPSRCNTDTVEIKDPTLAWIVIGICVAFWLVLLCGLIALTVLLLGTWIAKLSHPGIIIGVAYAVAVWYAVAIGWRIGNAIIFVALRDSKQI